jgi:hypothetical protein
MTLSNAERQARWRAKRDAWAMRATKEDVTKLQAEVAALKATIARERERRVMAEAKVRTAPTTERVGEDPRIGRLQKANQELRNKNRVLDKWYKEELEKVMKRVGKMPRATFAAVISCLHPDQRKKRTEKEIDEACGLFTQWKQDQDKH